MTHRKWQRKILLLFIGCIFLTACAARENSGMLTEAEVSESIGTTETSVEMTDADVPENGPFGEETQDAAGDLWRYVRDTDTKEDYLARAEEYQKRGMIRDRRDTLEQAYRLFGGKELLEELGEIFVNLEEETGETARMAKLMLTDFEIDEYRAECMHVLTEENWFDAMMPKLSDGARNYFKEADGNLQFVLRVGYDNQGEAFTEVFYYGIEDRILYLKYSGQNVMMLDSGFAQGEYDGAFTLWTIEGSKGNLRKESGFFEKGVLTSRDYTMEFHKGNAAGDIFDLWNQKENFSYTDVVTAKEGETKGSCVSALSNPIICEIYEPAERQEAQENKTVRIFDGEIQILTNEGWLSIGLVEDFEKEDFFYEYAAAKKISDQETGTSQEIPEPETVKPAPAPAQVKPTPQPAPVVQPTPAPAAPEPEEEEEEEEEPAPAPEPEPEPVGGSETDIEWTDDIL